MQTGVGCLQGGGKLVEENNDSKENTAFIVFCTVGFLQKIKE